MADWLVENPRARRSTPYGPAHRAVLSLARHVEVAEAIHLCPLHRPTPLRRLDALAAALGVRSVLYKDEAERFGFGAFKALGGVWAVGRAVQRLVEARGGGTPSLAALVEGRNRRTADRIVVATASSGNHGRAVAAGARLFGVRCTVFLPGFASAEKEAAIRARGADVMRLDGDYDFAVAECRRIAAERGWHVVSDTSWDGYVETPRDVMQGYAAIADEALGQFAAMPGSPHATHAFLQAGVGGLAAGVASFLWETLGDRRPTIVLAEPQSADCFFQSVREGRPVPASGDASTAMGGLACREPSPEAWAILRDCADFCAIVPEDAVAPAARRLARPLGEDPAIVAGPSAVCGLAALLSASADPAARRALGLDADSVVLLVGSEGAAGDPRWYAQAVGETPDEVAARAARQRSAGTR